MILIAYRIILNSIMIYHMYIFTTEKRKTNISLRRVFYRFSLFSGCKILPIFWLIRALLCQSTEDI